MDLAVLAALGAGIGWGVATTASGRAVRDISAPLLTSIYNLIAFGLFGVLFLVSDERTAIKSSNVDYILGKTFAAGLVAGLAFSIGMTVISIGLSRGRAGVVGPISSTFEVLIPFIYAVAAHRLPEPIALIGIAILFFVPWLVTRSHKVTTHTTSSPYDVALGCVAGVGFGSYYVGLYLAPRETPLLTMAIVQLISGLAMLAVHIFTHRSWKIKREHFSWATIFLIGEIAGAIFLRYAITHGSPAVVATLSAILYVTLLLVLSYFINHERFIKPQIIGFVLTVIGIALVVLNS